MLTASDITLPEIPSMGTWDDMIVAEETEKPQLTRAHSLQRKLSQSSTEGDVRKEVINIAITDPSHLFWVPASQHPEIAPTEFENYVDAHEFMVRKKSVKRRQSVLSVYFTANDSKEPSEQQTKLLRRSVSMQLPNANERHQLPEFLVFDRHSSPLDESQAIVPKAADGRALHRRGARTHFRKNAEHAQRPPLITRKSESDSHSPERVTLVDGSGIVPETKEQVDALDVGSIPDSATPADFTPQSGPTIQRSASSSGSSHRKSTWSWFWSEEKSKKNKVDPLEGSKNTKSTDTSIPKRFTLSSLFSRRTKHPSSLDKEGGLIAPKDFQLNKMFMTRLPLHVERAIYKLSHVKLANPRRPLKEQVLISNLMFWYLSVISSTEQQQLQPRKMLGKKKRPPKKAAKPTKKQTALMSNHPSHHQSTGFVVPENYLNPKQPSAKKKNQQQLDSSSDEDDDDLSSSSNSSSSEDEEDDDNRSLSMYKIKK
ncbi:hypothetical protein BY458DRAFT_456168 [Sporodiniella umbellata]|nr:hypothetical protein BY458DRAFT_456168 [Sporodiniella umbellata]